jgi:trehalose/maltose transport system permease protein
VTAGPERAEARAARALVLPAFALLGAVALYPVAATFGMSLQRILLVFQERRFVALRNYGELLRDARFWAALGHTAYFTAISVGAELVLAVPLALVLHRAVRGRGVLRAAVLLPWAIPTAVSAKLWSWLLEPGVGVVARLWPGPPVNWLGSPALALHAAIVLDVWKSTPFVALLVLAGLQGISPEVYAAAEVDGASPRRVFWSITLPLLRPAILVALLFRSLDAWRVFDAIYVLTEGGPANATETLSIYAYKTLVRAGDLGYGAALSVATVASAAVLSAIALAALARGAGGAE